MTGGDGRTEPSRSSKSIQTRHVGVHVVDPVTISSPTHSTTKAATPDDIPVTVRRRLLRIPHPGRWKFPIKPPLWLTLIINTIEPDDTLQEDVKFRMRRRVFSHFKQRLKDVCPFVSTLPRKKAGGEQDVLLTTSSKFSTSLAPLNTSYRRGTWMSHRTLCEMSLFPTTHLASLSHSPKFLRGFS